MKPTYQKLKSNHYSSEPSSSEYLSGSDLYTEIGYKIEDLIKQNPGYQNTCATRMSLALLKCDVSFVGRLSVKKGLYKHKKIETGAKLLADQLHKEFKGTEIFTDTKKAQTALFNKKGVVFFNKITGYDGGHIDLIEPNNQCHSHSYFDCQEVWFWALE